MSNNTIQSEIIYASVYYKATLFKPNKGPGDKCVVTFDVFNPKKQGFGNADSAKPINELGFSQLHISTSNNDWYTSEDSSNLFNSLNNSFKHFKFTDVTIYGSSMGAVGALIFSKCTLANNIILFSPQFSRREFIELSLIRKQANRNISGVILYDPFVRIDLKHANIIKNYFNNIKHVKLPFSGHPSLYIFREANCLGSLIKKLITRSISTSEIISIYREKKKLTKRYWSNISRRCKNTHPNISNKFRQIADDIK